MSKYETQYRWDKGMRMLSFALLTAVDLILGFALILDIASYPKRSYDEVMYAIAPTILGLIILMLLIYGTVRSFKKIGAVDEEFERMLRDAGVSDPAAFDELVAGMRRFQRFYINSEYLIDIKAHKSYDLRAVRVVSREVETHRNKNGEYFVYRCDLHFYDGVIRTVISSRSRKLTEEVYNEIMDAAAERSGIY